MNSTELAYPPPQALEPTPPGNVRGSLQLAWQAFLLNPRAYATVLEAEKPLRKGFVTLLVIILAISIGYALGLALDLLTTPRLDLLQSEILELIQNTTWFKQTASETADFSQNFEQIYLLGWQAMRTSGELPSWLGTGASLVGLMISALLGWLVYGLIAFLFARWLGGAAGLSQYLGVLALSYAPKLLAVAGAIPGLTVPGTLILGWMLVSKYQVTRSAHRLSWQRTLVVIFGAYLVIVLVSFIGFVLSLTSALLQIPGLDFIIKLLQGGSNAFGA